MGYAVGLLREEVVTRDDSGTPIVSGYADVLADGKPVVGIVSQAPGNFWSYVHAINQKYGPLTGYDIEIQRRGAKTDTMYVMFPSPTPVQIPDIQNRYKDFAPDLKGFLEKIGSQEYYVSYLGDGPVNLTPENNSPAMPEASVQLDEQTEFDRLRQSLMNK